MNKGYFVCRTCEACMWDIYRHIRETGHENYTAVVTMSSDAETQRSLDFLDRLWPVASQEDLLS